jgi:hypothetical protein
MSWLGRVRHDLVKRMVWAARDRREMGGDVVAGELRARLIDEEGRDATAGGRLGGAAGGGAGRDLT